MRTFADRRRVRAGWLVVLLAAAGCGPALAPLPAPRAPAPSVLVPEPAPAAAAAPNANVELRARRLMVPVDGVAVRQVRDTFAAQRDGGARRHGAIDIMAPRGTPVLAADDGSILRLGRNNLGGITIYQIDSTRRFVYYYAHLDGYAAALREGMPVTRGDVIGYVGSTGNASATAPHLHFQVMLYRERYWEGEAVNPFGVFELDGRQR